MDQTHNRRQGILLVAVSAVLWSTAGLFVRMAHLDTWTIVFWRSIFSALTLGAIAVVRSRGHLVRSFTGFGIHGAVTIVVIVISTISYVVALRLTTVATVMTVYATLPFIATAIAFAWLGERVTKRFLVAGAFAMAGIAVTSGAVGTSRDLGGILAAFIMTSGFATQLVNAKRHRSLDMLVLIALSAVACIPVAAPFIQRDIPGTLPAFGLCALWRPDDGVGVYSRVEGRPPGFIGGGRAHIDARRRARAILGLAFLCRGTDLSGHGRGPHRPGRCPLVSDHQPLCRGAKPLSCATMRWLFLLSRCRGR